VSVIKWVEGVENVDGVEDGVREDDVRK